jgi:membrane-associated protease RseP (regulator of RpoE activity)
MPFVIACPSCKAKLKAPDNAIGKAVKCPSCGSAIPVRAGGGIPDTVPAVPRPSLTGKPPPPRRTRTEEDDRDVEDGRARGSKDLTEPMGVKPTSKAVQRRSDDEDDDDRPSKPNAYLGAGFSPDTGDLEITNVYEGSPAEKAGLKVGDVIVRLDNKKVSKRSELAAFLSKRKPCDEITVDVRTVEDEEVTTDVKLSKRAAE